jgi:hypothetical protein
MPTNPTRTIAERIRALPEPYQTNLISWFRCGLDWPIQAPCQNLVKLEDLIRAAPLAFVVQLSAVLRETETYFGTAILVTLRPLPQTVSVSV